MGNFSAPVNLASRREEATAVNNILISQDTLALVKDSIACEKNESLKGEGQPYPVQTCQVIDFINIMKKVEKLEAAIKGFNCFKAPLLFSKSPSHFLLSFFKSL